jgi:hypothetical protein
MGIAMKYQDSSINQVAYNQIREYWGRNPDSKERAILRKLSFENQLKLVCETIDQGRDTFKDPTRKKTSQEFYMDGETVSGNAAYSRKIGDHCNEIWVAGRSAEEFLETVARSAPDFARPIHSYPMRDNGKALVHAPADATPEECIEIMRINGVPEHDVQKWERVLKNIRAREANA